MLSKFKKLSKLRQIYLLSVAAMILIMTVYTSYVANYSSKLSNSINQVGEYVEFQENTIGDFLKQAQMNYIEVLEQNWNALVQLSPNLKFEEKVNLFIERELTQTSNSLQRSLVLTIIEPSGKIIKKYFIPQYEDIATQLINLDHSQISNRIQTLNGDINIKFGEGQRIFYTGTKLTNGTEHFYVYIAFEEQIVFANFIQTLGIDNLVSIKEKADKIVIAGYISVILMVFAGFLGMLFMRQASITCEEISCPYYRNPLCAIWKLEEDSILKTPPTGGTNVR